jgi:hypothetical protein
MAGAGTRTWAANEVVTATNVQTYLQDQVCMVFADTTARDAITASEGMICYLKSIDQVQTYNGSAWVSVTSVLTGDVLTEDATNLRVGINESSPGAALHVEVKAATTDQLVRIYARTGAVHDADLSFALDNGTGETFTSVGHQRPHGHSHEWCDDRRWRYHNQRHRELFRHRR